MGLGSDYIPHEIMDVITHPCPNRCWRILIKGSLGVFAVKKIHAKPILNSLRAKTVIWFVVVIAKLFFYVASSKETNDIVVLGVKGNNILQNISWHYFCADVLHCQEHSMGYDIHVLNC